jgi:NTE family protein
MNERRDEQAEAPEPGPSAEEARLGVCLSGGGFRASFYALGALRYLAEANLLSRVDVISAVSGGSIAAAMVIDRWPDFVAAGGDERAFLEKIDRPFRERVTGRNLRNRWLGRSFVRRLLPRSPGRGVALGKTLTTNLYNHERVVDLPARPQVIFTSTELNSGRAFRIARDFVGSYDYGYIEPTPGAIELGTAVAASACFPLSFSIVWLPTEELPFNRPPKTLSLVDGGVYDNLGLEWFQGRAAGRPGSALRPDFLIVVNASGLLDRADRKYGARRALFRDLSVQYQQTLNLRVRWLIDNWLQEPGRGSYIGIGRDPRRYVDDQNVPVDPSFYTGALPSEIVRPLARLRTDVDRFTVEEAELLSYHAYWSLHARLKTFKPDFAVAKPRWHKERCSDMPAADREQVVARLERGAKRKLRR